jgi:hypothetical protein
VPLSRLWKRLWHAQGRYPCKSLKHHLLPVQDYQPHLLQAEVFYYCAPLLASRLDISWVDYWPGQAPALPEASSSQCSHTFAGPHETANLFCMPGAPMEPFQTSVLPGSMRRHFNPNPLSYFPQSTMRTTSQRMVSQNSECAPACLTRCMWAKCRPWLHADLLAAAGEPVAFLARPVGGLLCAGAARLLVSPSSPFSCIVARAHPFWRLAELHGGQSTLSCTVCLPSPCSKEYGFTVNSARERRRLVLTMAPVDWAVEWLRPVSPRFKMIGPVLAGPGNPLPDDLEARRLHCSHPLPTCSMACLARL